MNKKFKKLISYYRPHKWTFFAGIFAQIVWSACIVLAPLVIRRVTSVVFTLEKSAAIKVTAIGAAQAFGLFCVTLICSRFQKYQGKLMINKIEIDMKKELFNHFQNSSFSFFDNSLIGKIMTNITNDTFNLSIILKELPEVMTDLLLRFCCVFTIFFMTNARFALIIFGIYAAIFIFIGIFSPKISRLSLAVRESVSNLHGDLEESLSGIKTVQAFTNENLECERFSRGAADFSAKKKAYHKNMSLYETLTLNVAIVLIPIVTMILIFFIINGWLAPVNLVPFMLYTDILIGPFFSFVYLFGLVFDEFSAFSRIYETLSVKPTIFDAPDAADLRDVAGDIRFKNVTFAYGAGENIFNSLSLTIKSGEFVALVGASGGGKSTLCGLIPRFYDVSGGAILVDGHDVKTVKLHDLRQNIGFVQQDTFLFSGTIMENIRYGKPSATDEEVMEAAKFAYAHDFIMNFPEKYETNIGQRGLKLSGGQRQRLAIARVFLKNPPILIFDEATSSLDTESEKFIQKSLEKLAENRTTIVIAHRLSTIKNAPRILVLDRGKIVEEGTHEKLLAQNGVYAEFYGLL